MSELVFVGERPSSDGPRPKGRLDPTWPIAKTLASWLGPEALDQPFINVYPAVGALLPRPDLVHALIDQEGPRAVVPLGSMATSLFLSSHSLTNDAGCAYQVDGRWIVPFPHPSGRNRLLNGDEGKRIVGRCVVALVGVVGTKVTATNRTKVCLQHWEERVQ